MTPQEISDMVFNRLPAENNTEESLNSTYMKVAITNICRSQGKLSHVKEVYSILIPRVREEKERGLFSCMCGFSGKFDEQDFVKFTIKSRSFCPNCGETIQTVNAEPFQDA